MANDALRHYWYPVATRDEVGEKPFGTRLLDEAIVVYRTADRVVAFKDLCVHRGTQLSLGWIDGGNLVCAYHGWTYAPDGACVRIPSIDPERGIPRKAHAIVYFAQERYGLIWVCLNEPRAHIPPFPEFGDPSFRTYLQGVHYWKANAARLIENFIDTSHFPWVHSGLLGDRAAPKTAECTIRRQAGELFIESASGLLPQERFEGRGQRSIIQVTLPFAAQLTRFMGDGSCYVLTLFVAPLSTRELRRYAFQSRNFAFEKLDEEFQGYTDIVREQDRFIVESQRPEELPLELSEELHIKGPDCAGVAALVKMGNGICEEAHVVVGAVSPAPVFIRKAQELARGEKLTSNLIREIAREAGEAVDPVEDLRGPADYKREVVRVLVRRALTACVEGGSSR